MKEIQDRVALALSVEILGRIGRLERDKKPTKKGLPDGDFGVSSASLAACRCSGEIPLPAEGEWSLSTLSVSRIRRRDHAHERLFVVAIDGPAGSGKSTTAKRVAAELGFRHLDTGAMYRALTWLALQKQIDLEDASALAELAQNSPISFSPDDSGGQSVSISGEDVTEQIRSPEISAAVSRLSAHADVRLALVARQRELAASDAGVVMEGRDIGTVVFPNANVKVFLVASIEERAQRRVKELAEDGVAANVTDQMELMMKRDLTDSGREASPLVEAKDAVLIDTSKLSIDEQVNQVVNLARERMS